MTAIRKRCQNRSLSALFEAHQASLYTALCGLKAIFFRKYFILSLLSLLCAKICRELFGTSETDGDEDGFDHSEDAENGRIFQHREIKYSLTGYSRGN
jgi:hypothetical protein